MDGAPEFKLISDRQRFQRKVIKAVKLLADPVMATLGPDGLPILLERTGLPPLATKDGVTVANHVHVDDPELNTIIQAVKEAAVNTNTVAGDGTTTAILLTWAFVRETLPYLATNAITPQRLCNVLVELTQQLCLQLNNSAVMVNDTPARVKDVAYVSCNGDAEVAEAVVNAIDAVGPDGVITLEESAAGVTNLRLEEGFAINRAGYGCLGPLGACLINSRATQEVTYDHAAVVLYNGHIDSAQDTQACLNALTEFGAKPIPIVLIAHDFSPPILRAIFEYSLKGLVKCMPVKIPKLGSQFSQSQVLDDLASLTGGKVLQPGIHTMSDIKGVDSEFLGGADRVIMSRKSTIIYGGKGDGAEVEARAADLRQQVKDAPSEFDRDILKERLGRLVGGVAVIEVGGATDFEMKEKRDRIEDALNATRVALEEGIVPGGGTALLRAYLQLFDGQGGANKETTIALEVLQRVCESPLRQIVFNTGKSSPDLIVSNVSALLLDGAKLSAGYDARSDRIQDDLVAIGVVDPVKVIKTALTNAVSIATTLLRSGGSIVVKRTRHDDTASASNSMLPEDDGSDSNI